MNDRLRVLKYVEDLDVGVNEILQRYSFNRTSERLLSNDLALEDAYEAYLLQMNVLEYVKGRRYGQNDLVWVRRSSGDFKLFLVRCVLDDNDSDLQKIVDSAYAPGADAQPEPEFDRYGWKDENRYIDAEDYGVAARLRRYFAGRFNQHETDERYHRFGVMRDRADADAKVLRADLSNADPSRRTVFYPGQTFCIQPGGAVLYGFYRVWDCGTLEADIVYRLGYRGRQQMDGYSVDVIKCNDYSLRGVEYSSAETSKYFMSTKDRDIFAPQSDGESEVGDLVQRGRNDYVNTYTADIQFPRFRYGDRYVQFRDEQYMVFGSDVVSQDPDTALRRIRPGANCMAYSGKTRRGFTAVYVTYPDRGHFDEPGYNAANGGLVSNSFHCHVVGRWIEEPIQV
jgi:hypothetical protein